MRAIPLASVLALLPVVVLAQEAEPLVTDRPDFTESASVVPRGRVQLEAGATFAEADPFEEVTVGEVLFRIGVWRRVEARIGLNSYADVDGPGPDANGFEDPSLGLKVELAEGAALLVDTTVPVGADEIGEEDWQPGVVLALARDVSERIGLGANLGYSRASEADEGFDQGLASVAVGIGLAPRWGAFLEGYAVFPSGPGAGDEVVLDGGLTYLASPDLQLDARLGFGVSDAAPDVILGVGLSRRW